MDSEHERLVAELDSVRELSHGRYQYSEGKLGNNTLCLTRCGIGKVNAALGASAIIRHFAPDCVVSTGVAGGLDDVLNVTDVVVGAQVPGTCLMGGTSLGIERRRRCGKPHTRRTHLHGRPLHHTS